MTTPTITLNPIRHGVDVMSSEGHPCPMCGRLAWWWRNMNGRSSCVDCAKPDHDPSDCTNEACDICRQFYKDEAADRQQQEKQDGERER